MNQIIRIAFVLLATGLTGCKDQREAVIETGTSSEKPNIIVIFTDDQGYADVGVYGAEGFETPHIDALAKDGIQFTNFYVPATVCTPSRAALLTGQYPKRLGLHKGVISPYSKHGLEPEAFTLAEMLKEQGYATSIIGKWHLGHETKYLPNNQGFDSYYGVPYSNDMDGYYYKHNGFQSPPLPFYRDSNLIAEGVNQDLLTQMFTTEAIAQIKNKEEGTPFFMYLAHCMPHVPLHASEAFKGKSALGLYGDVIMELDWSVGELVKTLKAEGIYDNTLIVFTSDNGPHKGSAFPLRGQKAQTWEGGQRVPGIISWPDRIPKAIVSDQVVSTLDIFPTLAHISGATINDSLPMDGLNISELLENPSSKIAERPFYYYGRNGDLEAIRLGKWKLHIKKSIGWNTSEKGDFSLALYNLETDISETKNVVSQYPDVVTSLEKRLLDFDENMD